LEKVFPDSQISTLNNSKLVGKTTQSAGLQTSGFSNSNPAYKTTLSQELEQIRKLLNLSPSELVSHSNLSSSTRDQPSNLDPNFPYTTSLPPSTVHSLSQKFLLLKQKENMHHWLMENQQLESKQQKTKTFQDQTDRRKHTNKQKINIDH
jgi:hypothetical protein